MDLAFIAPTKHLNTVSAKGNILLALAHLIDDNGKNEYARFHRRAAERGVRIICDNGLFEGRQVDDEALLRRATAIKAQVVCAPDSLLNSDETIKRFKQFIRVKQDAGLVIDVMGIPQADTPAGWWDCFRFFDLSNDCQLIGLSILSIPAAFGEYFGTRTITNTRMELIRQLYSYEILLGRRLTKCHLLGLGDHLGDLTLSTRLLPDTIISNDSSSAYVHGRQGIRYTQLGNLKTGKDPRQVNFDTDEELTSEQYRDIVYNMSIAKMLAGQVPGGIFK